MGKLACPIDVVFLEPMQSHSLGDSHALVLTRAPTTDPRELRRSFSLQPPERMKGVWDVAVVPGAEAPHEKPVRVAEELLPQASPVCLPGHGQGDVAADGDHVNALANAHPLETQLPLSGSHAEHVAPRGQDPYRSPLPESGHVAL